MEKEFDVYGIGSALMDIIIEVDQGTLIEFDLTKGQMHLVDHERAKKMLDKVKHLPLQHFPGGSVSNTLAGIANLGGRVGFCGKVGRDKHGDLYETILVKEGIKPNLHRCDVAATGHCITFITPDKERTFVTHLGAAVNLKKAEFIDEDLKKSRILHLEGYQLELPELKEICHHAAETAKKSGILVSLDLSDAALIKRNLADFRHFVKTYANIVFANESEARAFTDKDNEEEALHDIASQCKIACVKLGERGSLIKSGSEFHRIAPFAVNTISTTGAGDMYAAGILFGIAKGLPLQKAGKIASYAAAQVVAQLPARLSYSLKQKIKEI